MADKQSGSGRPRKYPPKVIRRVAKMLKAGEAPADIAAAPIEGFTVNISRVYEIRRRLVDAGELA